MLYELREYLVADRRLEDELARARATILGDGRPGLFERHGIPKPWAMWRCIHGRALPCVAFLYAWQGAEQRSTAFPGLFNDPEWLALRARTNGTGEIVDRMDDILFRGLVAGPPLPEGGYYEFCRHETRSDPVLNDERVHVIGPLQPLCGDDNRPLSIVQRAQPFSDLTATSSVRNLFISIGL